MLDDAEGDEWKSRRCAAVSMPVAALGLRNASGPPFLKPEVQLFYKAKNPRPKDVQDLEACLPLMTRSQKQWLCNAMTAAYGDGAPWIERIRAAVNDPRAK